MIRTYIFVKGKRIRKKISLYKLFLSTTLDKTSLFYIAILFSYSLFAFYRIGEVPDFIKQIFGFIDNVFAHPEWLLIPLLLLPLYFIFQSFSRPGVLFSSAEFLLAILPFKRQRLWLLTFLEKLLKSLFIILVVATIIFIVTTVSTGKLSVLVLIVLLIVASMTVVQWKLYQLHVGWRLMIFLVTSSFASIVVFSQHVMAILLYGLYLGGLLVFSLRRLFTRVDWPRVIAASDFDIWNMQLMSLATKIKFQKDAQPSLWYRLKDWKKEFPYEKTFPYNRLWYIYGEKQISIILRVTGAQFLLLMVVSYFKQLYFLLIIIVVIHVQTTFLVSLFRERLYTGLVNVLPWDIEEFRNTFIHWANLVSLVLLIPTGFYTVFYFDKWFIAYVVYVMAMFYYMLHIKLQKYIDELTKKDFHPHLLEGVGYVLLIIFGLSAWYPLLLVVGFVIFVTMYMKFFRKL